MKTAWSDIPVGTIVDSDIIKLSAAGQLITDDFEPKLVKQACYELRASDIFYNVASPKEFKRIQKSAVGYLLKPNCYVVCIVKEGLRLPSNVLGRILTKGSLFSIGILPVNTYADPGFEGRLGITLYNASRRYLVIRPGEAIAKIEFQILPKSVDRPYSGQHGYETKIWPIADTLIADIDNEPLLAAHVNDEYNELLESFGPYIGQMYRELRFYRIGIWIQLFAILAGFSILFAVQGRIGLVWSLGLGIASNLLTTLGFNLWAARRRSK